MKKHFYTHIIEIESLVVELDKLNLSDQEKIHLARLIDSNLHHTVLDVILSQLPEDEKQVFLRNLKESNHDKIWEHLNSIVDKIEEKIKNAAEQLKKELRHDIKEAKEQT